MMLHVEGTYMKEFKTPYHILCECSVFMEKRQRFLEVPFTEPAQAPIDSILKLDEEGYLLGGTRSKISSSFSAVGSQQQPPIK